MRRPLLAVAILPFLLAVSRGGAEADDLARDRKLIQGTWSVAAYDMDGRPLPPDIVKKMSVVIKADRLVIAPRVVARRSTTPAEGKQAEVKFLVEEDQADEAAYRLDRTKKGNVIELTQDAGRGAVRKMTGLYALDGDALTVCIPLPDHKLPKKMPEAPKAGVVRLVLKRAADGTPGR